MPETQHTLNAVILPDPNNFAPYVQRYLNGETIASLAAEIGISPQCFYLRMRRWSFHETGDNSAYAELITESLVNRVAEADMKLEFAASAVEVARAREIARFSRMDLERRRPELYGEKRQVKEDKTIRVIIQRDPQQIAIQPSQIVRTSTNNDIIDVSQVIEK